MYQAWTARGQMDIILTLTPCYSLGRKPVSQTLVDVQLSVVVTQILVHHWLSGKAAPES